MAAVIKRMYKGTLGTTAGTLYQSPASGAVGVIKRITITNITGAAATITLTIGGTDYLNTYTIAAKDTMFIDESMPMAPSETITALAGTASAINVFIGGVEM